TRDALVRVSDVRHVNVRDVDIGDVSDVDLAYIAIRVMIARNERLTRPQREPRNPDPRPSDERHQMRRIYRPPHARAGYPDPGASRESPPPIMKRRESPGSVVNPRPSPGFYPGQVAVVKRRPADGHARPPAPAAFRNLAPRAIGV